MIEESREKALRIGRVISQKKGLDLIILDVHSLASFTDYFIIVSGRSIRQVQALANHIEEALRAEKIRPLGVEGAREGSWVLMDYGDVIVHLFYQPAREFYNLEGLWEEASKVPLSAEGEAAEA